MTLAPAMFRLGLVHFMLLCASGKLVFPRMKRHRKLRNSGVTVEKVTREEWEQRAGNHDTRQDMGYAAKRAKGGASDLGELEEEAIQPQSEANQHTRYMKYANSTGNCIFYDQVFVVTDSSIYGLRRQNKVALR